MRMCLQAQASSENEKRIENLLRSVHEEHVKEMVEDMAKETFKNESCEINMSHMNGEAIDCWNTRNSERMD